MCFRLVSFCLSLSGEAILRETIFKTLTNVADIHLITLSRPYSLQSRRLWTMECGNMIPCKPSASENKLLASDMMAWLGLRAVQITLRKKENCCGKSTSTIMMGLCQNQNATNMLSNTFSVHIFSVLIDRRIMNSQNRKYAFDQELWIGRAKNNGRFPFCLGMRAAQKMDWPCQLSNK